VTRQSVQTAVGLIVVGSHFGILSLVLTSTAFFHVQLSEAITFTTVIAPLFAGYTTAIVRFFLRNETHRREKPVRASFPFVLISLVTPCLLSCLVLFFFLGYALNRLPINLEAARNIIASLEGFFGIYVGYILEELFQYKPPR
jgi:phosphate/sulfate permease